MIVNSGANFSLILEANCSVDVAFRALTEDITKWWTTDFEGVSSSTEDQFIVRFGKTYKVMKVCQLITNKRIIWKCIDSYIDYAKLDKSNEWNGTTIEWSLLSKDDKVVIKMLHTGLTPEIECFDVCRQGWTDFINGSLNTFLHTGRGVPFDVVHG